VVVEPGFNNIKIIDSKLISQLWRRLINILYWFSYIIYHLLSLQDIFQDLFRPSTHSVILFLSGQKIKTVLFHDIPLFTFITVVEDGSLGSYVTFNEYDSFYSSVTVALEDSFKEIDTIG